VFKIVIEGVLELHFEKTNPRAEAPTAVIELLALNHPEAGVVVPDRAGLPSIVTKNWCKNSTDMVPELSIVPDRVEEFANHLSVEFDPLRVSGKTDQGDPKSNQTALEMSDSGWEYGEPNCSPEKVGVVGAPLASEIQ